MYIVHEYTYSMFDSSSPVPNSKYVAYSPDNYETISIFQSQSQSRFSTLYHFLSVYDVHVDLFTYVQHTTYAPDFPGSLECSKSRIWDLKYEESWSSSYFHIDESRNSGIPGISHFIMIHHSRVSLPTLPTPNSKFETQLSSNTVYENTNTQSFKIQQISNGKYKIQGELMIILELGTHLIY